MENAAKALVIAGGILLAIMTLSLLVYMTGVTSRMAQAQDEKKEAEQLVAFNMEYEAYNKRRMYGVDVMTVVNKAINYNATLTPTEANKAINVEIDLLEDFIATKQIVTEYSNGEVYEEDPVNINDWSLSESRGGERDIEVNFNTSQKIVDFFQDQSVNDEIIVLEENSRYIKKQINYSALTNFKRAIFECTQCEDRNDDGRIDYMKFEQYKSYTEY
ncbi:MAG: hypothetical protein IJB90_01855 [Clostridia bacterium]|nr:hypothetical protein [Clostridia bacterium]